MEALGFMKQRKRMCDYYGDDTCVCDDSRGTCPALDMDCSFGTDHPEHLIAIVEKWAKEHPEEAEVATDLKNGEPCVKTIQDDLGGAIYRAIASNKIRIENLEQDVAVIRINLSVLDDRIYALREKVDHTPTKEPNQTQEPKRTNKDALLAAFPDVRIDYNGIPDMCPRALDKNYNNCNDFASCSVCRCAYWLAEVREDENRE